ISSASNRYGEHGSRRSGKWTGNSGSSPGRRLKSRPHNFDSAPPRPPFAISILTAVNEWVLICAGEKDVHTAVRLGFVATTNLGGEIKGAWTSELNKWFIGRKRVAIVEDNDKTGYAHVAEVARAPRGIVPSIKIVQFRELPEHGDLTDWIDQDKTRGHAELLARIEAAKPAVGYELIQASTITGRIVHWI